MPILTADRLDAAKTRHDVTALEDSVFLLTLGEPWLPTFHERWPDARAWVVGS